MALMLSPNFCWTIAIALLVGVSPTSAESTYHQEIQTDRENLNKRLHSPDSLLGMMERFDVPRGQTTIGRTSESSLQLKVSNGPSHFGRAVWDGTTLIVTPAQGVTMQKAYTPDQIMLDQARLTTTSTDRNDGVGVQIGSVILSFTWWAKSGRLRMSVTDREAAYIRTAPDRLWYKADTKYRVQARWVPLTPPARTKVRNTDGENVDREVVGYAEFSLEDQIVRLSAVKQGAGLFLAFSDRTAPKETYGGGRYLYAAAPVNGFITLDFNYAVNPNCALNPNWICVLPPRENRLPIAIRAGEKNYPGLQIE